MRDVLGGVGVLDVEIGGEQIAVSIVFKDVLDGNLPGLVIFFARIPPSQQRLEFLEAQGLGFGIAVAAFGQRVFVVPDFAGGSADGEEEQVGGDGGVGGEDAVRQADDGVQGEFLEQLLLDARGDAIGKEGAVGDDDGGPARFGRAAKLAHDELQEQERGFGGTHVLGEVVLDAGFFFATEGWIGEYNIHTVARADVAQGRRQAVAVGDVWGFEAVEQEVHLAEQVGQRFGFAAANAGALEGLVILGSLRLRFEVLEGFDLEATRAAGGVFHHLTQARVGDFDHQLHDGARRVELARVACRVAHLLEHAFVEHAEGVHFGGGGEVDLVDFVDHVAQQVAVLHTVSGALEDGGDDVRARVVVGALEVAQVGEQAGAFGAIGPGGFVVVDEGKQGVAGDAARIGGPIAPAVG